MIESECCMTAGQLSADAETVLLYLLGTRATVERTLRAIRESAQMNNSGRAERALHELMVEGYVIDLGDWTFELTSDGVREARDLHPDHNPRNVTNNVYQNIDRVDGGNVAMTGMLNERNDVFSTPAPSLPQPGSNATIVDPANRREISQTLQRLRHELPTADMHPLRNNITDKKQEKHKIAAVRYLLAFEILKDVLPIPIINGDTLGRSPQADITLRHDNYISSLHCQFEIRRDSTLPQHNLYVQDLGSRNGTQIDDVFVEPQQLYQIQHGSHLRIGNTVVVVIQVPY